MDRVMGLGGCFGFWVVLWIIVFVLGGALFRCVLWIIVFVLGGALCISGLKG